MNQRLKFGFIAGCLGAVILVVVMYILMVVGMGNPGFVQMYRSTFGTHPPTDHLIAALLFIISGGIWGIVFALLVKRPTVFKGFLFGLLPTLWLWLVVNAVLQKPLFNGFTVPGILMPLIFNMLIWGSFIGWYMFKKQSIPDRLNLT
jgi:hypothetical protein